jgi:tRNA 2-selenouridine synthase SelU
MQRYPLVWLEDSFANRVERILRDYVINLSAEFMAVHGEEDGRRLFAERMLQSMANIHKRLERKGDLWRDLPTTQVDLAEAIACLEREIKQ